MNSSSPSTMFQFKLPRAYVAHLLHKAGGPPAPLSPVVRLWTKLRGTSPNSDPGAELPLSEDALVAAMETLLRPNKMIGIRLGCNRNVPEQRRFASIEDDGVQVGLLELVSGDVLLEGFKSGNDLIDWLTTVIAPLQFAHQPGARLIPENLTTGQYLHTLHLIDFYRRCHYQSMLDYTAEDELSFSSRSFEQALFESLHSGDYRWLLPASNIVAPTSITGPGEDSFQWLGEHGLVTRAKDAKHNGLWTFDEVGERLGVEFFAGWLGSAGIETGLVTEKGPRRGREALVVHTTIKGLHVFRLAPDGTVRYDPLGADALPECLRTLIGQSAGEIVPPFETPVVQRSTDPQHGAIFCPQCGASVPAGARFCAACGKPVQQPATPTCPKCGKPVHAGEKFCGSCGHHLS